MRDFMLTFLSLLVVWYIGFCMGKYAYASRLKAAIKNISESMKKHLEELKDESIQSREMDATDTKKRTQTDAVQHKEQ